MTQFPLVEVPATPGIYALKNKKLGKIYIGCSMNLRERHIIWQRAFRNIATIKNGPMYDLLKKHGTEGWVFVVLEEHPDIDKLNLHGREQVVIARTRELYLDGVVNQTTKTTKVKEYVPHVAGKSTVVDVENQPIPLKDVAEQLGCSYNTLMKRLADYRKKGVHQVSFSELAEKSEKWRGIVI